MTKKRKSRKSLKRKIFSRSWRRLNRKKKKKLPKSQKKS